jgi:CP family cyanate transporter-like MFS transporter
VAAVVLTALNLRTAVTSVGPLLSEVQDGIGLSSALAGVLTTLPVVCFALVGWYAPALASRLGEHRAVTGALALMTVGLLGRALVSSPAAFLLLSAVALLGGAVGNVLLPSLVKRHFPDRIGPLTAVYTTALAIGLTSAAAASVPLAEAAGTGGWRVGLGAWALLSAVAVVPWLWHLADRGRAGGVARERSGARMLGSRTAWALALFFGAQSLHAYVSFGWFALFFQERGGASAAHAGFLLAVVTGLSIPVSAAVPALAARRPSQWPLVVVHAGCYVVAYVGMLAAPAALGGVLWAALVGVGSGAFPLALTMIALRTRTADATASLSAFAQSVGYVLAGGGPLLVGVLHGRSGGWTGSFVLLFAALAVMVVAGWYASQPRYVEDEVAPA